MKLTSATLTLSASTTTRRGNTSVSVERASVETGRCAKPASMVRLSATVDVLIPSIVLLLVF